MKVDVSGSEGFLKQKTSPFTLNRLISVGQRDSEKRSRERFLLHSDGATCPKAFGRTGVPRIQKKFKGLACREFGCPDRQPLTHQNQAVEFF